MKIAIVGTGIAGLVCGHRLHPEHDVTLFEARDRLGGHTHTHRVPEADGWQAVDTGFIVFNHRTYPHFTRLLGTLGVASHETVMSFSVRNDGAGIEYASHGLGGLFARRRSLLDPRIWRLGREILRFNKVVGEALEGPAEDTTTVAAFATRHGFSETFVENYLVPLGSSLWSCPPGTFLTFPVRFVLEFLANHGMTTYADQPVWRVVTGGSQRYVEAITRPFADRIRLATPVSAAQRVAGGVDLVHAGGVERFDEVILACHADQALRMQGAADPVETELLSAFPYAQNEAILHTDAAALPRRRRAWAAWNYRIRDSRTQRAILTYDMTRLQGLKTDLRYCVTLNDGAGIDPARIISRMRYAHPVFTSGRAAAHARHGELIRRRGLSYCGAYWGYGFHEDGVRSALAVCNAFEEAPATRPLAEVGAR